MRNMKRLPDAPVELGIVRVAMGADPVELRRRLRVEGGEQGHIDTASVQARRNEPGDAFPGAVVLRRRAPRNRPENRDLHEDILARNPAPAGGS